MTMYRDGNLETLLRYLGSHGRVYPANSDYLETIWFLAGQPKHLPPLILSSINSSDEEHKERLVAQAKYANELGTDYVHRLAQYVYLIPQQDWVTHQEQFYVERDIAENTRRHNEALERERLRNVKSGRN
jgi:hypothetical protein